MNWEIKWMEWAGQWWTSPVLDQALPYLTYLGSQIAVLLFIILSWILTKQRRILYRILLLYGIQSVVVYGLKFLVHRPRPPSFLWRVPAIYRGEILDPSFPSAHTLYAFMMATFLAHWFPRYRIVFLIIAGFIGWTRIYLGLHYPTDVIAGSLLGYGVTKLFLLRIDLSLTSPYLPSKKEGNK